MALQDRAVRPRKRNGERGQSAIEATLMAPWIFLLFLGIFNLGFFGYSIISVENAARVGVLYGSEDPGVPASEICKPVANELSMLPNIGATYLSSGTCTSLPLNITYSTITAANSADGEPAVRLAVTYESIPLFPIPGLTGRINITRAVEARVKN